MKTIKMNENITFHLLNYINNRTNYAVIISGNYGIGKTYYIKNQLFPQIQKIMIDDNGVEKQKFRTIVISLFGVKNIEEIEKLIFFEAFKVNKTVKIGGAFLKGLLNTVNFDTKAFLEDAELTSGKLNNYENIVICIDDIDRRSKDLGLSEVFGFINDLVENNDAKVILVANEDILRGDGNTEKEDGYSILREKVIGISFPFIVDLNGIFESLVNFYKNDEKKYYDFLIQEKEYILDCIKTNKNNIRNFIFFLETFRNVFKELDQELDNNERLHLKKNEILIRILKFFLPISIEYKLGELGKENKKELLEYLKGSRIDWGLLNLQGEEREKTYIDKFKDKYNFKGNELIYFESIFNFILAFETYEVSKTILELESLYNTNSNNYDEKNEIFSKLRYWDFLDLSIDNYKSYSKRMLKLATDGKLQLDEYTEVFVYLIRFGNILQLDVSKLKKTLLKAINGNIEKYALKRNHLLNKSAMVPEHENYKDYEEILQACYDVNNKNKVRLQNIALKREYDVFELEPRKFMDNYSHNNVVIDKPFFVSQNFQKFWKTLLKMSNQDLLEFGYLIEQRYHNIYPDLQVEKVFVHKLKENVEKKIMSKRVNKLKKVPYIFLLKKINSIIHQFN